MKSLKFGPAIILASAISIILGLISISSAAELSANRRAVASATPTPAPPTLQMSLVYPTNGVLNSGGSETIQASITVGPPPSISIQKYRVVVAVRDAKGHIVRHHAFHPVSNQSMANLDMKSVPAGSYNVSADVYHRGRRLTGSNSYGVTKEGPTPTPIDSATPTPAPTTTPRPTPTPAPTPTAKPTKTPTPKRTRTATPTPKSTKTPTPTPSATGSPIASGLDQYGGTTSVQCTNGAAPHFYTEKMGNRWWICDPAGNGFFLKGVYDIVANNNNDQTSFIQAKYAAGPLPSQEANWALEQVRRLQVWGFNMTADYSVAEVTPAATDPAWGTSDDTIPVKMPYVTGEMVSYASFQNADNCNISSPVKDMMNGVGSVYNSYHSNFGDYFDPSFSTCVANVISNDTWGIQRAITSKYNNYLVYIIIDESDETGFLDGGPDFPTVGTSGQMGSGPGASPHAAWITLVTAPTQTSNSAQGVTYSDHTVYTKQAFSTWLAARYSNIAALNSAWNSNYSTFGASGAGWGVGSGILDENGTCPSAANGQSCWVGDVETLAGETAAMQSDMSAFYVYYLDQYFSVVTAKFNAAAPGVLLQMQLGGWGAPPRKEVLTEAAKYLTLPILSSVPTWPCANCTDTQAEINFTGQYLGDRPWINWIGFPAQADSAESEYAATNPSLFTTQAERGVSYQGMIDASVDASDTATGTYHVVGFDWWGLYDMNSQESNWGLLTPHDNPYDGKSATISGDGPDQWGYPTGGEAANYGDFIGDVTTANTGAYGALTSTP